LIAIDDFQEKISFIFNAIKKNVRNKANFLSNETAGMPLRTVPYRRPIRIIGAG